ncbi:MAG: cation:proton antiporter regulatory subunit [Bacillota bacterium]
MASIRECDLPGIGRKFQIQTRSGDKLVVVVHDDGRREMYHFSPDDPEQSVSVVTLDDEEARAVAGILGGLSYRPRALEDVEMTFDEMVVEWYKVGPGAAAVGKTIGELDLRQSTGATVIGIIEPDHTKKLNPGAEQVIREGSTLLVMGDRRQVEAVKKLILAGR